MSLTDSTRTLLSPAQSLQAYNDALKTLGPKQRREHKGKAMDEIVGSVVLPTFQVVSMLSNLVVEPASRRKGHASSLIDAVVEWSGPRPVVLLVDSTNEPARRLYEREGFVGVGESDGVAVVVEGGEVTEVEVREEMMLKRVKPVKSGAL